MRWLDNWIDKMYHKKHFWDPTARDVKIYKLKTQKLLAEVQISDYALADLDEDTIYKMLLETMLPEIKKCMEVNCVHEPTLQQTAIFGRMATYIETSDIRWSGWYDALQKEAWVRRKG